MSKGHPFFLVHLSVLLDVQSLSYFIPSSESGLPPQLALRVIYHFILGNNVRLLAVRKNGAAQEVYVSDNKIQPETKTEDCGKFVEKFSGTYM